MVSRFSHLMAVGIEGRRHRIENEKGWGRRKGGMLDTTLNKIARQNAEDRA